eukprot:1160645-Pelagomonas_calceolata.AAC.4
MSRHHTSARSITLPRNLCLHEEVVNWPFLDAGNPSDRIGSEGAAEPTKADYQALNKDSECL